jgi:hypothetical protein
LEQGVAPFFMPVRFVSHLIFFPFFLQFAVNVIAFPEPTPEERKVLGS